MSEPNIAVVRRWIELFNERDDAGQFLSLLDPEVELQTPGGPRLHGHAEVGDWFEAGYENVQPRIIPDRFVAEGELVVGLGSTEGRQIESGEIAHQSESAGAFWLRGGKIIRWRPLKAMRLHLNEAGLSEQRFSSLVREAPGLAFAASSDRPTEVCSSGARPSRISDSRGSAHLVPDHINTDAMVRRAGVALARALASSVTVRELDHVFCLVTDPHQVARRLEDDGWVLDAGQAHRGQGTRNRRLVWREQFVELLWVTDAAEARSNSLRLDRRADWATTGASPFGLAFRGQVDPAHGDEFWLYDTLGPRIWIHRDNERVPERPLVFVLEATDEEMEQRRRRVGMSEPAALRRPGELREVRVRGPSAPFLPPFAGPSIVCEQGPHLLELVVGDDGSARPVSDALIIRSQAPHSARLRPRLDGAFP